MKIPDFLKYFSKLTALLAVLACTLPASADSGTEDVASQAPDASPGTVAPAAAHPVLEEHQAALANRNALLFSPSLQFKSAAGTPAYYQEAFDRQCTSARAGDANGYYGMGWLYANGRGVQKDLVMASALLGKAAQLGHARAREILEVMPRPAEAPLMPACLSAPAAEPEATVREEPVDFYDKDGRIYRLVSRLAPQYGIDTDLAMAVIAVESGFNPRVTSPRNAQGLMQLIPDTARRFQVRDAYDPEQNIKGGLAYLRWLMDQFEGNVELVTAAYNAGEKTVEKYGGIPPYPETRNYVQKIRTLYRKSTHPYRDRMGRMIGHTSP